MRKRPWGVVSIAASAIVLSVFAGCGDDSAVPANDGGTSSSSSGSASSSGATSSSGGTSGTSTSGGSSGGSSGATSSGGSSGGSSGVDGSTDSATDGSTDAATDAATDASQDAATDAPPPVDSGPTCSAPGTTCAAPGECCSGTCINTKCAPAVCKTDTPAEACSFDAECCSGKCGAAGTGNCVALAGGGGCRVEGNACTTGDQCCSKQCSGGKCINASFCTQLGDSCGNDFECCGGSCVKQGADALGRCQTIVSPGGNNCSPTGTVCTGAGCDNKCCSLSCGPYGTAGVNVCQPPSGCRPQDELCATSGDCCGGPGQLTGQAANGNTNPPLMCVVPAGETLGRCEGAQCLRPGAVCKASSGACGGTSNNCCESLLPDGNKAPSGFCNSVANVDACCSRDALGIPRCRGVNFVCTDAGVPAGQICATSADCCGAPCVGGKCQAVCVAKGGDCTVTADCCAPEECVFSPGSTKGICGGTILPDGGVTDAEPPPVDSGSDAAVCALYGQSCATVSCCNNVPCVGNICRFN